MANENMPQIASRKVNTSDKIKYRIRDLQRLADRIIQQNWGMTKMQESWFKKNWLDVSKYLPDSLPRWWDTNLTAPAPIYNTIYPTWYRNQWETVEPDSWAINNPFNMRRRMPTFKEIDNNEWNDWEYLNTKNTGVWWEKILAPIVMWATAPFTFTPYLIADSIWTAYATLRNWYNALVDFYNSWRAQAKEKEQALKTIRDINSNLKKLEELQYNAKNFENMKEENNPIVDWTKDTYQNTFNWVLYPATKEYMNEQLQLVTDDAVKWMKKDQAQHNLNEYRDRNGNRIDNKEYYVNKVPTKSELLSQELNAMTDKLKDLWF